jgi:putative ABC transport system permease protein
MRNETRSSFANTISGTDLIVGARSSPAQLLLYAVFRIGDATNNMSWQSHVDLSSHPKVAWSVPMSLGDSHRGFRVLGTTEGYFRHYRHARGKALQLAQGRVFDDVYDAVLGSEVARKLNYRLGDQIILAHGASDVAFARHGDKPFRVTGILKPTGTPVDHTVHVGLEGLEAIHIGWEHGAPLPGTGATAERTRNMDLTPKTITAVLLGLKSKVSTFQVQRFINEYPQEPLSAILPGVALSQLWDLIGIAENGLLLVSVFVVIVGMFGMLTALMTGLNERRREMAILRSVGARPVHVFALIMGEAGFLTLLGVMLGFSALHAILLLARPIMQNQFGISLALGAPSITEAGLLCAVILAGFLVGVIPSYRAYRLSLIDGLSVRV